MRCIKESETRKKRHSNACDMLNRREMTLTLHDHIDFVLLLMPMQVNKISKINIKTGRDKYLKEVKVIVAHRHKLRHKFDIFHADAKINTAR